MQQIDAETRQARRKNKEKMNKNTEGKQTRSENRTKEKKEKKPIRRIFPIWLRLIIIFLLCFLAVILGLIVGFSMLGDGQPMDVLEIEFWEHLIDIISGVE